MRTLCIGVIGVLAGCTAPPEDDWTPTPEHPWRKVRTRAQAFPVGPAGQSTLIQVRTHGEQLPDGRVAGCCTEVTWAEPRNPDDLSGRTRGRLVTHRCVLGDGPDLVHNDADCGCPKTCLCWEAPGGTPNELGFATVKDWGAVMEAKRTVVEIQLVQLGQALKLYRLETGRYPASLDDLLKPTDQFPKGFVVEVPLDPWGNAYDYFLHDMGYRLASLGADGAAGGEGADADILSDG